MTIGSPSQIDVLLHCHTQGFQKHERCDAPAVIESIDLLLRSGAIRPTEEYYETTELGAAWVKAICNTRIPKLVYVDELGKILT